ncbi:MAG: C39 family peptidase [Anaerolineaceae bacterium]|nr:C39 family peptidase [Anaerolineaceae bacterium]
MDSKTATTIITKTFFLTLIIFAAALPVCAQETMIPDDFDWGAYLQSWEDEWDSWGTVPQQYYYDYSYQEPITYDWYGQTGTIGVPTPVSPYSYGSPDYVPVPVYQEQTEGWGNGSWNQNDANADQWFYQVQDEFYDDFSEWSGSQTILPSAYVSGFTGYAQTYNLDCETRSAVDLAAYFGVNINSDEFLYYLPKSDDPNEGFVGSWTDARGHIPPASYGVYQEPVAALLRKYGLNAVGAYAYTEDALKAQISAGKPVMVWVVGNVEIGYSVPYTPASNGRTTYVVPYQHTVVVIGYDENNVTVQDGALRYTRDWKTFLLSWGALGNRAIYVK